jgi:UDP-N-acetyl-D-glucosamine dehydrogenase
LTTTQEPDISYIRSAADAVAANLTDGQLVILESTTYPGTTEEVLLPALSEVRGGVVGEDFYLAFSPERVDPGNHNFQTHNTTKVVGGVTASCLEAGVAFYSQIISKVVPVSSPRVAELTKVFENTFRAVNIALVNELAMLCDKMGINVWEVVEAAGTKPFGMMTFWPGPGVGGHCIPIDPYYLTWKAREFDFHTRFIELCREINMAMPHFVRDKVIRALNQQRKSLNGANILVIGVAYKKNISDWRESPAIKIHRGPAGRQGAAAGRRADQRGPGGGRLRADHHGPQRLRLRLHRQPGEGRRRHPERHEERRPAPGPDHSPLSPNVEQERLFQWGSGADAPPWPHWSSLLG